MQNMVDALWVAVSGALVFFMQPGFQMVESGLTREKNSINVAIKNLTDIGISLFIYWLIGFALMFGKSAGGILGFTNFIPGAMGNVEFNMCNFLLLMARILSRDKTIALKEFLERLYNPEFKQSALESVIHCHTAGSSWPIRQNAAEEMPREVYRRSFCTVEYVSSNQHITSTFIFILTVGMSLMYSTLSESY